MERAQHSPDNASTAESPNGDVNGTTAGNKRKRASIAHAYSPDSINHDDNEHDEHGEEGQGGMRPHMKRACNECRQQKLRCDVESEPFKQCTRCTRLKLACRIDANFKRVGKRSKHAEMEREIVDLKRELAAYKEAGGDRMQTSVTPSSPFAPLSEHSVANMALHHGAAGSLLDLRHGIDTSSRRQTVDLTKNKKLGDTIVSNERIADLFAHYFRHYHAFLPVLDPEKTPENYHELSPLLFWTIIAVASRRYKEDPTLLTGLATPLSQLMWTTLQGVPQNYHVVKALALMCQWPLPTNSTSTDPSFIICGIMMQIALQTGLHRPSHVQDFSRIRVELRVEDVQDRLKTWTTCNIVAQSLSTGYGQPPKSVYDYTLMSLSLNSEGGLPANLHWRLQVERFADKVSQKFYNNRTDPIGVTGDQERAAWISLLVEDYRDLERRMTGRANPIDMLHLQAANMHLRLAAFFDSSSAPNYVNDLLELYFATETFLTTALGLDDPSGPELRHSTSYIMQMILAGGFTLLKLLNSFFAQHLDVAAARRLFNSTIWAIRRTSITNNDLPSRLAEVLAQLWRRYGAATRAPPAAVDGSLQLKVRCRMSMSLVYDSIWRWREEVAADAGAPSLDSAVNNPTNPEDGPGSLTAASGVRSGAGSGAVTPAKLTQLGAATAAATNDTLLGPADAAALSYMSQPGLPSYSDGYYNVFDPLNWILDGSIEFANTADAGMLDSLDGLSWS